MSYVIYDMNISTVYDINPSSSLKPMTYDREITFNHDNIHPISVSLLSISNALYGRILKKNTTFLVL